MGGEATDGPRVDPPLVEPGAAPRRPRRRHLLVAGVLAALVASGVLSWKLVVATPGEPGPEEAADPDTATPEDAVVPLAPAPPRPLRERTHKTVTAFTSEHRVVVTVDDATAEALPLVPDGSVLAAGPVTAGATVAWSTTPSRGGSRPFGLWAAVGPAGAPRGVGAGLGLLPGPRVHVWTQSADGTALEPVGGGARVELPWNLVPLALTPEGVVVRSRGTGELLVWRGDRPPLRQPPGVAGGEVLDVAGSRVLVAAGCPRCRLLLWDVDATARWLPAPAGARFARAAALSPDGRRVAAAFATAGGRAVAVIDVATGRVVVPAGGALGRDAPVLAWSSSGRWLFAWPGPEGALLAHRLGATTVATTGVRLEGAVALVVG